MSNKNIILSNKYAKFIEVNGYLEFDRLKSYGKRLDILAGTAVRFEPGSRLTVTLVDISGKKFISGGNNIATGIYEPENENKLNEIMSNILSNNFYHKPQPEANEFFSEGTPVNRDIYISIFGPTKGDRIRLADSDLWIEVEDDLTVYGDECKFGGGKVLREGMGQCTGVRDAESLDTVITNALIIDWSGIYKVR